MPDAVSGMMSRDFRKSQSTNKKLDQQKGFSSNIIFMDGEFTELSEKGTQFISIALIKSNGDSYYAINADFDCKKCSDWVKENVLLPLYIQNVSGDLENFNKLVGKSEKQIAEEIKQFIGDSKPYLIADVNQFDWMGICGLFGVFGIPFHYIPIDFASILWANGIDPDIDRIEFAKSKGIDVSNFKKHNALDDTRVLKLLYEKLS